MNLQQYIEHPERLNRETLYQLRSLTAMYPYYQPARLLLLKNLYLLHDPTFDEELRQAAMYIADRSRLFDLVEARHYQLRSDAQDNNQDTAGQARHTSGTDRTAELIDDFLNQIPEEKEPEGERRKPTAADATHDYVAYLLSNESEEQRQKEESETPKLRGHDLIDDFLEHDDGRMQLQDEPEYEPEIEETTDSAESEDTGFFTETLARIYIKQGRYSKALEIIRRLNLIYPKKNRYFADQIRFLEKLILNNNTKSE